MAGQSGGPTGVPQPKSLDFGVGGGAASMVIGEGPMKGGRNDDGKHFDLSSDGDLVLPSCVTKAEEVGNVSQQFTPRDTPKVIQQGDRTVVVGG